MRILVTNDDGIHAPGLAVAEKIARDLTDDVWVVAPETEQSGASHSLTLSQPLRLREIAPKRYAISGTPTDCVMMAVAQLMGDGKPDLVLSGVNRGANLAEDVTYSGTIAGAMEGTALGIPSIALSQAYGFEEGHAVRWQCAQAHGANIVRRLLKSGWPPEVLMNVNFPDREPENIAGVEIVAQGKRDLQTAVIDSRVDMRGIAYFWIGFRRVRSNPRQGTDLHAIYEGRIAITPLHLNLTEHRVLEGMRAAFTSDSQA
ncbi:MAG TPA: 5'/3'-nucleotidase SurE [Rhizomicrobium sp.]|nr:5'/3'-nucleotidase SurE [Rhizomicrobium sp.]